MSQITYLLGAGASALALPTIAQLPDRVKDFSSWIEDPKWDLPNEFFNNYPTLGTKQKIREEFLQSLKWLHQESAREGSIDNYAKQLYLTRNQNNREDYKKFVKLKATITGYFCLDQIRQHSKPGEKIHTPDPRYTRFLRHLFNSDFKLPSNVSVITWNYDFQFELGIRIIRNENNIQNCRAYLNLFPSGGYNKNNGFSVIKLNGTTDILNTNVMEYHRPVNEFEKEVSKLTMEEVIFSYAIISQGKMPSMLNFAWEENDEVNKARNLAEISTANTEILVVIGYSFPDFNRIIDKKIISGMKNLKKVYIQDINENMEDHIRNIRELHLEDSKIIFDRKRPEDFFAPLESFTWN